MRPTTPRRVVPSVVAIALVAAVLPPGGSPSMPADLDPWLSRRLPAAAPDTPLRVLVHGTTADAALDAVADAGLTPVATWERVGVAVAWGTPAEVASVARQPGITYVEGDRPLVWHTDTTHVATRAAEARRRRDPRGRPVDGRGVSIAVVDSGVDGTHRMFRLPDGRSKVRRNLKEICAAAGPSAPYPDQAANRRCWVSASDTDTASTSGHGTHVAGIAAGRRIRTADGRAVGGAAPGATLIALGVGQGVTVYAGNSAMNWVLEHHADPCGDGTCPPIRVTNHSYGPDGGGTFDPRSATVKLQRALVAEGVVVVWAAGNDGGDGSRVRTNPWAQDPTPGVVMVANYDDGDAGRRDGELAGSSSRGQRGAPATYPDLSAPGTRVVSACDVTLPLCLSGSDGRDRTTSRMSGTSMAAPHVAGAVALLLQVRPRLAPAQVEHLLEDTAHRFTAGSRYERDPRNRRTPTSPDKGHGLLDVAAALDALLRR